MVEIIERFPREVATSSSVITPMEMLHSAISNGADIAILEKLMGLQERYEASQARKAFDAAMSEAKASMGTVHKTTKGNYGMYADFASVARTVDPILSEHGLRYRFNVQQDGKMRVTCVVSHRDGYSEETTLESPIDASGSKNPVQQIGSTLEYLRRYTLLAALGMATSKDDDGKGAMAGAPINDDQVAQLRDALKFIGGHEARFLKFIRVEKIEDIPASRFDECMNVIKGSRK